MAIEGQRPIEKRAPDCLIDCIMAADVFANNFQFAVYIENSRGVNSAGARKIPLRLPQFFRQWKQRLDLDPNIRWFDRRKILPDRIDACFAANPATAGNRAEALPGV